MLLERLNNYCFYRSFFYVYFTSWVKKQILVNDEPLRDHVVSGIHLYQWSVMLEITITLNLLAHTKYQWILFGHPRDQTEIIPFHMRLISVDKKFQWFGFSLFLPQNHSKICRLIMNTHIFGVTCFEKDESYESHHCSFLMGFSHVKYLRWNQNENIYKCWFWLFFLLFFMNGLHKHIYVEIKYDLHGTSRILIVCKKEEKKNDHQMKNAINYRLIS